MKRHRPTTLEPISAAMFVAIAAHAVLVAAGWWWWQEKTAGAAGIHGHSLVWRTPADFKSSLAKTTALAVTVTPSGKAAPPPAAPKTDDPPVQKATLIARPPQDLAMEPVPNTPAAPLFAPASPAPKPSANRSITLRRVHDRAGSAGTGIPAPPIASPTLLDIARLNTMRPSARPGSAAADNAVIEEVNMDLVDEAVNTAFLAGWTAPSIDAVPAAQRAARLNISIGRDGSILKAQMSKFSGSHALDQSILEAAAKVKKISATLPSNFSKNSYDLELNFLLLP